MKKFNYPVYVLLSFCSNGGAVFAKIFSSSKSQEVWLLPPLKISIECEDNTDIKATCYSFERVQNGKFVRFITKYEYRNALKKALVEFSE